MTGPLMIIDPEERFTLAVEGAELTLRRVDSASLVALEAKARENGSQVNEEVLDYVLLDWSGVASPLGGAPVPCTRANKARLPTPVKLKVLAAAQKLSLAE